jgi:hypothetical protein
VALLAMLNRSMVALLSATSGLNLKLKIIYFLYFVERTL